MTLSAIRRPGWGCPLTNAEIAAMFGVSCSAVEQAVHLALQHLADHPEIQAVALAMELRKPGQEPPLQPGFCYCQGCGRPIRPSDPKRPRCLRCYLRKRWHSKGD